MSDNLDKARESLKYGKFSEAAGFAREAVGANPANAEAQSLLGVSLSRLNQHAEAEAALREAIRLAPEAAKHHYNLAAHLFAVGNRNDARFAAMSALDREPNHRGATDLLARIAREESPFHQEAEYGSPAPNPFSAYTPPPPARPVHSIGFIRSLGWAWDVLGWFLFIAMSVTRFTLDARIAKYIQGPGDQFEQSMKLAEKVFSENSSLFIAFLIWFGLLTSWWAFDMADRRPPGGLVAMGVVGILAFMCCPLLAVVLFPLYYFLRLKASQTPGL